MRRVTLIGLIGALFALTSVAQAHDTRQVWTESKAAKIVTRNARVMVPAAERASLERELRDSIRAFLVYQLIAREGEAQLPEPEHYAPAKFRRAREKLQDGLAIESVACRGSNRAQGGRFKHFRCAVTTEVLEIPKAAIEPPKEEGGPWTLILGPSRFVGPLHAQLEVHITGKSSIAYRRAS